MTFAFDKTYAAYWKEKVKNSSHGPKVPEKGVQTFFIKKLKIKKTDAVLDLGCGHGALFPVIKKFSKNVSGVDVNKEALSYASKYPYKKLSKGSAEKTNLPAEYFDNIIAWAVYDVVEQEQALREENRILKQRGTLLITGKNKKYFADDTEAFVAERNAKLKDFPNHFTDVSTLLRQAKSFGFKVEQAFGFKRRGDFGTLTYIDITKSRTFVGYEFLLILRKIGEPLSKKITLTDEYSDTAKIIAKKTAPKNKFKTMKSFFKWHQETYGK